MIAHDELEEVLFALHGVFDGDEPVDELTHALQCAYLADQAHSGRELIAAALLHDIARSPVIARDYLDMPHDVTAALWLRPRFGDYIAWLAGAHVAAKLFLLETEPDYGEKLSAESVKSAEFQRTTRHLEFAEHPWWPDVLRLRRWDDAAKDPKAPLPDLEQILRLVRPLRVS